MTDEALGTSFRQAMRRLATTVTLVTTGSGDHRAGMVATAVMSACGDPPTIAVAINRSAGLHGPVSDGEYFAVNLLADRHRDLVAIFSGGRKGVDRFTDGDWLEGIDGVPVLADALASLVCRKIGAIEVSTHSLFLGQVKCAVNHPEIDPLIWMDGGFARRTVTNDL